MEVLCYQYKQKRKEVSKHVRVLQRQLKRIRIKNKILMSKMESQKAEIQSLMRKNNELVHYVQAEKYQQAILKDKNNDLIARNYNIALDYNATKEELIRSNKVITFTDDILKITTEYLLKAKQAVKDYFIYIPPGINKENTEETDTGDKCNSKFLSSQEKSHASDSQEERELSAVTEVEESPSLPLIPDVEEVSSLINNGFKETLPLPVINEDSYSLTERVLDTEENHTLPTIPEEEDIPLLSQEMQPLSVNDNSYSSPVHDFETEENPGVPLIPEGNDMLSLSLALRDKHHHLAESSMSDNKNNNKDENEVSMISDSGYKNSDGMLNESLRISLEKSSSEVCSSLPNSNKGTGNEGKLKKHFERNLRSSSSKDINIRSPVKANRRKVNKENTKQSKGKKLTKTANSDNVNPPLRKLRKRNTVNQDLSGSSVGFCSEENGVKTRPKRCVPKINYKV